MAASLIGMTLPSWASHLEYKLAPPPLLLVQAFVNTRDVEDGSDLLSDAGSAAAWLNGLIAMALRHPRTDANPSAILC